eukprot:11201671-Lingulodinium_polyedra.AAC.1
MTAPAPGALVKRNGGVLPLPGWMNHSNWKPSSSSHSSLLLLAGPEGLPEELGLEVLLALLASARPCSGAPPPLLRRGCL